MNIEFIHVMLAIAAGLWATPVSRVEPSAVARQPTFGSNRPVPGAVMKVSLGTSWAAHASASEAISEMGEMDMLQLQKSMEKKLQLESMISNCLHSTSEAEGTIVGKDLIKSDLDSMSEMGEKESLRLQLLSHDIRRAPAAYFNPKEITLDRPAAVEDRRDSLSELGEEQQLRVQTVMERMNKADSAQSNLVQKVSK